MWSKLNFTGLPVVDVPSKLAAEEVAEIHLAVSKGSIGSRGATGGRRYPVRGVVHARWPGLGCITRGGVRW